MKVNYTKTENSIFGITGLLLLLAILNLPYGYYTFLRIIVTLSSIYLLVIRKTELIIVGILIAIIFNPILPIHLTKEIWVLIDTIFGIFFLIFWWKNLKSQEK